MVYFITKSRMQSKLPRVAEGIEEVILADKCGWQTTEVKVKC